MSKTPTKSAQEQAPSAPSAPAAMSLDETLAHLFTYRQPTDITGPKFKRIRAAAASALAAIGAQDFETITGVISTLYRAIYEEAPASADRTASLRCVQLARNAMNDLACGNRKIDYHTLAAQQIELARYQANTAIALAS